MKVQPIYSSKNMSGRNIRLRPEQEKILKKEILINAIKKVGWFEVVWYPFFAIAGLVAMLVVGISQQSFSWILIISVLELWLAMLANNFVARGMRIGLIISCFSLAGYSVIAGFTQVWGEMITNLVLYLPLELYAFFAWKKAVNKDDKLEKIKETKLKDVALWVGLLVICSGVCFAILQFVIKQNYALLNSVLIMSFLIGTLLRNKRYKFFWYFFMLGNITGIILWTLIAINVNIDALPIIVSYFATLTNNFNGLFIWNKIYRSNKKTKGVLLAKRKIDINKVITLKRTYQSMVHKINLQPDKKK